MSIRNQVSLVGRITKDLVIKAFDNGNKVLNFTMAIDDSYLNKDTGEAVERTYFINCNSYNKLAEHIDKNYGKGYQIAITGKLITRNYEVEGVNKTVCEVEINSADILLRKVPQQ